jgi:hypothetical protein
MMRFLLPALAFAASGAFAQTAEVRDIDLTPLVASLGLAGTVAALEPYPPSAGRDFAIGGVQFLRAVEKTMQLRYRHNADFGDLDIPVLRLPVSTNPDADAFYPALVTDLFAELVADMQTARRALSRADGDFGVTVDLTRVWFDINENNTRDPGEDLMDAAAAAFGRAGPDAGVTSLVVRFDTADAAWLLAYTHLLQSVGHLFLAFDPTEVIAEVNTALETMRDLAGPPPPTRPSYLRDVTDWVDNIAVVYGALNRQPDPVHTRATRTGLLAMIAENRRFWALVAKETDNDREWIPNNAQTSAMGIELPDDAGLSWLNVLGDAEDLLEGRQLVPHWRIDPGAGVNLAMLLDNPIPVDIVTWVQGHGLTPYMQQGPLVNLDSLNRFVAMFQGNALLFMVWLN